MPRLHSAAPKESSFHPLTAGIGRWHSLATRLARSRAAAQKVHREQSSAHLRHALYELENDLRHLCTKLGILASVSGRIKSFDSICRKIRIRQLAYAAIFDHAGIRVIVGSDVDCYRLFDCLHRKYRRVSGHMRDYIAKPKSNGYRSLHTTLLIRKNIPIEVQLRTREMDQQALHGLGALRSYDREPERLRCEPAR